MAVASPDFPRASRRSGVCASPDFLPGLHRRSVGIAVAVTFASALSVSTVHAQTAGEPEASAKVAAGATIRAYDISAGSLDTVLTRFGREAGILLTYAPALTAGRQSPGVQGRFDVPAAFGQLLAGTGLSASPQGVGYTLVPHGSPAVATLASGGGSGDVALPATHVQAQAWSDAYRLPADANIARADTPLLDIPQIINVVPHQVLADQRARTLDDALINVSGIVQGNTLAGTQDTLLKRGFGGNRDGSIMHNGMPLVQGRGLNANADAVEVLKGPTSLLYGIMDPGGVINVVSKRPLLKPYTAVSVAGTTYGHGKNGAQETLDTTGPIGDSGLAYRLVVDQNNQQYWRNFGSQRETLVAPTLAYYGRDTQVVLSYEYRNFLTPFDRGTVIDPTTNKPLAVSARERLDDVHNEMTGQSHLAQITVDHQFNPDWKAHFGYSYNTETYDAGQLRVNGINTRTGILSRSNDGTRGSDSTDSYGIAYLDGKVHLAGMRHDLQFGGDWEYRRIYRRDLIRQAATCTFSYLDPVYGCEVIPTTVSASDSDQTDTLHDASLFFQDAIHVTERWIVVGGVRLLTYSQLAGKGRPFRVNTNLSDSKWLPRAGVIYKATDYLSLYSSYSESLKPTSTIAPLSSGVVIDSNVAPEHARSYEVGAKLDMPNGLSGSLAVFNIDKRNVLVSQFNDATKATDWRTSGAARSRGVELDVSGRIGQRWNVIASYAFIDAKTTDDPLYTGNTLVNVARHTASLAGVYDWGPVLGDGGGNLRLGAVGRYIGARPGDSANSFTLPAYFVADVFATYDTKIGRHPVHYQFNVKNVFNKTYYPSSASQYFVAIGDARSATLSATFEF
ncbi:TonB-dependent siderophore receptor [Pandoraea fibrosis]|uniref:TonB-dependent siderophore receptor n=1 Tax=Pandoraea fibrosis TaxID=1891094 RepID=A0ABX6HXM3_9BURK|nr:TonB-dependent receptor [Pandoraea fibrosis]QHE94390.1 TonB-dependent siderophore receptor [Pandoraea fibrosis]QHF15228.1 TonB-dependent siderophore receptor [Pandoraea fibrosis]